MSRPESRVISVKPKNSENHDKDVHLFQNRISSRPVYKATGTNTPILLSIAPCDGAASCRLTNRLDEMNQIRSLLSFRFETNEIFIFLCDPSPTVSTGPKLNYKRNASINYDPEEFHSSWDTIIHLSRLIARAARDRGHCVPSLILGTFVLMEFERVFPFPLRQYQYKL